MINKKNQNNQCNQKAWNAQKHTKYKRMEKQHNQLPKWSVQQSFLYAKLKIVLSRYMYGGNKEINEPKEKQNKQQTQTPPDNEYVLQNLHDKKRNK